MDHNNSDVDDLVRMAQEGVEETVRSVFFIKTKSWFSCNVCDVM